MEYFLPHSKFLASFRNFINLQARSVNGYLKGGSRGVLTRRKYLASHNYPEYRRFMEGVGAVDCVRRRT